MEPLRNKNHPDEPPASCPAAAQQQSSSPSLLLRACCFRRNFCTSELVDGPSCYANTKKLSEHKQNQEAGLKAKKGGLSAGGGSGALAKYTDVVFNRLLATAGQAAIKETGTLMQAQMFPQGECHIWCVCGAVTSARHLQACKRPQVHGVFLQQLAS